jgi:hypothetical protein
VNFGDEHAQVPEKGTRPTFLARDVCTNPNMQTRQQYPVFSVRVFRARIMHRAAQFCPFSWEIPFAYRQDTDQPH